MPAVENARAVEDSPREYLFNFVFDSPRDLVFAVWTQAALVQQWWGPHGTNNPVHQWDARPGGRIHIGMTAPDGTAEPMGGTFHEVQPDRIIFTGTAFEDEDGHPRFETLNTIQLHEQDGKTAVSVRAVVIRAYSGAPSALEGMNQGWTESLERMGQVLAGL